ncbi:hypothetical protein acsn021_06320 [Anaerocolumna cellulosilytica]|uniref:Uncharacterized protein n=1 Tax=Anaerocolumna cellulosilytica TaxID=433286 RepID=A0A6S6QNZ0_9FIRM|nr:hypothetical protein [Anaerocolumna cellulosilytica]MBB5198086.1 hypothetical protein [Anaerocolumna cellulosilytica]BCJ93063.1 hypothetical protein acsn021_06320 [Anaerocolumna cellulosilytica]
MKKKSSKSDKNDEIQLLTQERLITKAERNYIEDRLDLKKYKKIVCICLALYFILILVLCSFFYFLDSIKSAFMVFIIVNLCFALAVIPPRYQMIKLFKQKEIWVREAVYIGMNKYHNIWVEINYNGLIKQVSMSASLQERIYKGDKVIIITTRSFRGIFLARE